MSLVYSICHAIMFTFGICQKTSNGFHRIYNKEKTKVACRMFSFWKRPHVVYPIIMLLKLSTQLKASHEMHRLCSELISKTRMTRIFGAESLCLRYSEVFCREICSKMVFRSNFFYKNYEFVLRRELCLSFWIYRKKKKKNETHYVFGICSFVYLNGDNEQTPSVTSLHLADYFYSSFPCEWNFCCWFFVQFTQKLTSRVSRDNELDSNLLTNTQNKYINYVNIQW